MTKVKTLVEVGREVWNKLKARAAEKDVRVSGALENILRDYFGLKEEVAGEKVG